MKKKGKWFRVGFLDHFIRDLNCFLRGGGGKSGIKKRKEKLAIQQFSSRPPSPSNEGVSTEHFLFPETLLSLSRGDLHL